MDAALELLTSKVPGVSAAVVREGRVVVASAGLADIGTAAPAGPETAYLWFSMTKIVTATAVMQLADRGALSLDDPVARFLPEFPEPREGWPRVRIRHLLSHSAGLANPVPVRWVHPAGSPGRDSREFAIELLRRHSRLRFPAGSKALYSNLGYIALGEVIAAASGTSYEAYVAERILRPLSMDRTGFTYDGLGADVAAGYQPRLSPMTPLFRLLLPPGIVGGKAIRASGRKLDVGFGWFRRGRGRSRAEYLEHLGGGGGFWNMMRIYPERRLGVLSMGNATRYDHELVARAALRSGP